MSLHEQIPNSLFKGKQSRDGKPTQTVDCSTAPPEARVVGEQCQSTSKRAERLKKI